MLGGEDDNLVLDKEAISTPETRRQTSHNIYYQMMQKQKGIVWKWEAKKCRDYEAISTSETRRQSQPERIRGNLLPSRAGCRNLLLLEHESDLNKDARPRTTQFHQNSWRRK